jgi:hypothetical protein
MVVEVAELIVQHLEQQAQVVAAQSALFGD